MLIYRVKESIMYKNTNLKTFAVLFIMVAMLNLVVGCNNEQPIITEPFKSSIDDYSEDHYMSAEDPEFNEALNKILSDQLVQPYIELYKSEGYYYSAAYSFIEEGYSLSEDSTDSTYIRSVTLAMLYTPDTSIQAKYIMYINTDIGEIILPYILSFVDPGSNSGFTYITDGVWKKYLDGEILPRKGYENNPMVTTFSDFLDCVAEESAAGCAVAMIGCAATGPGFPSCAAAGCAIAIVGAIVHCALTSW